MTSNITSTNFQQEVLQSPVPVLVDFTAKWCPPCRAISPIIDELDAESQGLYKVFKVDVDESEDLTVKYAIAGIPALLVFKNGVKTEHLSGFQKKEVLKGLLT